MMLLEEILIKIKKLVLELNSKCNNNCIYCYIPEENRKAHKETSADYFKKALKKFKFTKNTDFTGGEPTLYTNLIPLIRYAKEMGYDSINLVTNGRRLAYEEYLNKLTNAGITRFIITLEGPNAKIADSITQSPGSYDQTVRAISNLKKNRIIFGLTIIVNKLNYVHIPQMIEQSVSFGADFLNIQFLLPYVEDEKVICKRIPNSSIPTYRESIPYVLKGVSNNKDKIKINMHFIPFCLVRGYEEYIEKETSKKDRLILNYMGYSYNMGAHLQKGGTKTKKCINCKYTNQCPGFFKSYANELGINSEIENE